ncbi:uncharacterized protein [Nicotiana sylvestris]|uniref:uncharacterized protein n=1 Tax=Nicotiana sylvestris TaxID=4096 RepID=UPI00388C3DE2
MYLDLKELYWWKSIKKQVADYVAKCLNCQQVKAEHQRPGGLVKGQHWYGSFEALYGQRYMSIVGWFEAVEVPLIGPEFIGEALEKVQLIRERLKMAQSCQKSNSD